MSQVTKVKKLVPALATFASVIEASKKDQEIILARVPCIYCPMQFQKDKRATIWVLINSSSKINALTPAYPKQLGLRVWKIDVRAQKIDGSLVKTFGMVIAGFQIEDKLGRERFF